jgi:hypothetical protein
VKAARRHGRAKESTMPDTSPAEAAPAPSDLAFSAGSFGSVPHEITEGMDAAACPFLNTAAQLGLEGDSLARVMRAFAVAFELSDPSRLEEAESES